MLKRNFTTAALLCSFQLLLLVVWSASALDGSKLTELLTELANEDLGVKQFQTYLDDNVPYVESALDGSDLVKTTARSLKQKFDSRIEVVRSLRDTIEDEYASFSSTSAFSDCCEASLDEEDTRFQSKVNLDEVCNSGEQLASATKLVTNKVKDKMKEHLRNHPTIRWQYFGSEEGVMTVYPSFRQCDPDYDPRFRPFYVSTTTPEPKDVVVVIDTSGSMSKSVDRTSNRIKVAIHAANTVINTLGPNDRIGVVSFESTPKTPPGDTRSTCYSTMLAAATPINKEYLTKYVGSLRAYGGTAYSKAFQAAFELIQEAGDLQFDNRTRDQVILFLTDGEPSDSQQDILQTIRQENAKLQNKVVILTYGIGEAPEEAEDLLTRIAEQADYDRSAGEIRQGKFTPVPNANDLRRIMGSYYDFFSKTGNIPKVNFVVPYYDAFGLGMVTSACLPVYNFATLVGVTCVDITMSDLLSDVTYFKEGELSYAFMIDSQARLLMHPLLPQPYAVEEDPIFVQMPSLETFNGVEEVMQSMLRGDSSQKEVSSLRVISRGDAVYEGVETRTVPSTYYWHPVEGTEFSVCLVVAKQDQQASVVWSQPYDQTFTYHRLDLHDPDSSNVCNYYGQLGLKDSSTVQFSPEAFTLPYEYLSTEETTTTIDRFTVYMTGKSGINPGFKEGVRETVSVTAYFDQLLDSVGQPGYVVWRYIGTKDGVFRIRPGSSLEKEYDHTLRPWYQRSVSQKGSLTISTPYIDLFGAGYVVTLSKTLYEGRDTKVHSTDDLAIGVMAMDFSLAYMYYMLVENFPECSTGPNSCFIAEKSGFIVVHKDFLTNDSSQIPELEHVHITDKEPDIAHGLFTQGAMTKTACINFESLTNQFFWTISVRTGNKLVTADWELHEVEDSNVFLVVKKFSEQKSKDCSCSVSARGGLGSCLGLNDCECPCSSRTDIYRYCQDLFDLSSDSWPPCSPRVPNVNLDGARTEDLPDTIPQCFNYDCGDKLRFYDCAQSAGCSWCSVQKNGDLLAKPYCGSYDKCPFGVVDDTDASTTVTTPSATTTKSGDGGSGGDGDGDNDSSSSSSDNNVGVIAGVAAGVLVVLLAIGVAVFIYMRKRSGHSPKPPPSRHEQGISSQVTASGSAQEFNNPVMQSRPTPMPSASPAAYAPQTNQDRNTYETIDGYLEPSPPAYTDISSYNNRAFDGR